MNHMAWLVWSGHWSMHCVHNWGMDDGRLSNISGAGNGQNAWGDNLKFFTLSSKVLDFRNPLGSFLLREQTDNTYQFEHFDLGFVVSTKQVELNTEGLALNWCLSIERLRFYSQSPTEHNTNIDHNGCVSHVSTLQTCKRVEKQHDSQMFWSATD